MSQKGITINNSEQLVQRKFLTKVYGWMSLALLLSGITAFIVATSPFLINLVFGNKIGFPLLAIGEIVLVWWLSASIRKISTMTASIAFLAYSVINGATLASIFHVFSLNSIIVVFLVSALMFIGMSLYGVFSKSDIMSFGRYFSMAIIGLIVASVINIFLKSSGFNWVISIVTVVIFTGLTAYDTRKMILVSQQADGSDMFQKASIIGALELYLDFINIFLALLRIFGKSRD
ncbi:MAG: Bax inhibitor-1/YccA family protein [Treponema sp.]|nr:Bax inhibitor-1/YccA family protein [Treponema sp.]